jgi:hypothetical protein
MPGGTGLTAHAFVGPSPLVHALVTDATAPAGEAGDQHLVQDAAIWIS